MPQAAKSSSDGLGIGGARQQTAARVAEKFDFIGYVLAAVFAEQLHQ